MPRRLLAVLLTVLALTAACGDDTEEVGTSADGPPAADGGDDAGEPVLLVEVGGGFVPVEANFQTLPMLVVGGDGTVVEPGPQIAIYPGPALLALNTYRAPDDALGAIEEAARAAGLDRDDVDYGEPPVADAGTTSVAVSVDGVVHVHRAYALGIEDGTTAGDGAMGGAAGLDEEQLAARAALSGFLGEVSRILADAAAGAEPYAVERYRLWVRPAAEADGGVPSDIDPAEPLEWDVPGLELAAATCLPVEGEAVAAVTELLAGADALTRFTSGGEDWAVVARPVLAHEPTCPTD